MELLLTAQAFLEQAFIGSNSFTRRAKAYDGKESQMIPKLQASLEKLTDTDAVVRFTRKTP